MQSKKSLGQHFLKSKSVVADIISAANLSASDTVLEIGPGKGVLTEALLRHAERVVAVEKDADLIAYLQEKFAAEIASGKCVLVHKDILSFSPEDEGLKDKKYKLVANIPYYITGQLLRRFLAEHLKPNSIVLLLQKEVAQRIVSKDGKESLLSVSVKAFGTPKYVKKVPARYFSPAPKVDSAILAITDIHSPFSSVNEETHFFDILHKGFAHKRKLLKSNLGCGAETLAQCSIEEKARAENVTLKQWICLSKHLS